MKIKLKKLNDNAVIPTKGREGDFCYDVVAVSEEEIAPNVWRYKLGFAYEICREKLDSLVFRNKDFISLMSNDNEKPFINVDYNISIDARPRSSVWKTGMILANCAGTLN